MRLDNRVTLVTGAGSGIGRAIAVRFAREGAFVVAADIVAAKARETVALVQAAGGRAAAVTVDIANETSVRAMVDAAVREVSTIDVLVNCAAISEGEGIVGLDPAVWDRNLAVVLRGPFLCMQAVLPIMVAQRRGAIVNIGSVNGIMAFGEYPYSAAKAGLVSLSQNAAVEFGPSGIRVNTICPGTVRTPIWDARVANDPSIFERLSQWYPLNRVAEPEEIASVALFLASDEASFVTGATIIADGGLTAGMGRMTRELAGKGS